MKCKYCGKEHAEYYNELIDVHYCHDCSQEAREEWLGAIDKVLEFSKRKENNDE